MKKYARLGENINQKTEEGLVFRIYNFQNDS